MEPTAAPTVRLTREAPGKYTYRGLFIRRLRSDKASAPWVVMVNGAESYIAVQRRTLYDIRRWLASPEGARHFEAEVKTGPMEAVLVRRAAGRYWYRGLRVERHRLVGRSGWWFVVLGDLDQVIFRSRQLRLVRQWLAQPKAERHFPCAETTAPRPADAQLTRSAASREHTWCWQATLSVLGLPVPARWPNRFGTGRSCKHPYTYQLERAVAEGYEMERVPVAYARITLARFIAEHPVGTFLVGTSGHIMALVDGVLTDTAVSSTGRRVVTEAHQLTRKEIAA